MNDIRCTLHVIIISYVNRFGVTEREKIVLRSPATTADCQDGMISEDLAHPLADFNQTAERSTDTTAICTNRSLGLDPVSPGANAESVAI